MDYLDYQIVVSSLRTMMRYDYSAYFHTMKIILVSRERASAAECPQSSL